MRLHSEGFSLQTGPLELTVICRALTTKLNLVVYGRGSELRRPAAILTLRLLGNWHRISRVGGARAP